MKNSYKLAITLASVFAVALTVIMAFVLFNYAGWESTGEGALALTLASAFGITLLKFAMIIVGSVIGGLIALPIVLKYHYNSSKAKPEEIQAS